MRNMSRAAAVVGAALCAVAGAVASNAGEVSVTFDWVPVQNGSTVEAASGTLTLLLPSFSSAMDPSSPNGTWYYSPTYASDGGAEAALVGLDFTFSNGMNVDWGSNATLSFTSIGAPNTTTPLSGNPLVWATDDGLLVPQVSPGQAAAAAANYLITGFQLTGQTSGGMSIYFDLTNSSGSVYSPGPQESYNGITGGISDEGFWKLESITPVPLPDTLPLLLSGLIGCGLFLAPRRSLLRHHAPG